LSICVYYHITDNQKIVVKMVIDKFYRQIIKIITDNLKFVNNYQQILIIDKYWNWFLIFIYLLFFFFLFFFFTSFPPPAPLFPFPPPPSALSLSSHHLLLPSLTSHLFSLSIFLFLFVFIFLPILIILLQPHCQWVVVVPSHHCRHATMPSLSHLLFFLFLFLLFLFHLLLLLFFFLSSYSSISS